MSNKITPDLPPPDHRGFYTDEHDSLETVRQQCKRGDRMVFYGINTCWWAISWGQLYKHRPHVMTIAGRETMSPGLPCDPRGGMLLQTEDVDGFFDSAIKNAVHYGKHGLRAFLAAYHGNVVVSQIDQRPTCFAGWEDYNRVLDEFDARVKASIDDFMRGK